MRLDHNKSIKLVIISVALLFLLSKLLYPIHNPDLWYELKAARYILAEQTIPQEDIFSYTTEGTRWVGHHWLFQLLAYSFYRLLGINGIILLKIIVVLLTYVILSALVFKGRNYTLLAVLLFFSVQTQTGWFLARARMFSELFIALYLFLLHRYKYAPDKYRRLILLLIPLQLIWVNMHSGAFMGIFITGCFIAGELWEKKRPQRLLMVAAGLVLTSGLTPFGYEIILYPFRQIAPLRAVGLEEVLPFFETGLFAAQRPYYISLAVLTVVAAVLNFRKMPKSYLILGTGLLILSWLTIRGIPLFALVAFPLNAMNIEDIIRRWPDLKLTKARFLRVPAQIAIICLMVQQIAWADIGLGPGELAFKGSADFIEQAAPRGNMFNTYGMGGYLIWRLWPQWKVMIDGRNVHSRQFHESYLAAFRDHSEFKRLVERYDITFAILDYMFIGKTHALIRRLNEDDQWALVYFDHQAVIFFKETPQNREVIRRYAIDPSRFKPEQAPGQTGQEEGLWLRRRNPPNRFFSRAYLFNIMGLADPEIAYLRLALDQQPDSPEIHYQLGLAYGRLQQTEQAIAHLQAAARIDRGSAAAHYNLGVAYMAQGSYCQAQQAFERTLKISPDYEQTHFLLGVAWAQTGQTQKAAKQLKKALKTETDKAQLDKIYGILHALYAQEKVR